ncbi:hypothetical protein DPMN_033037 [Dreissena polymorpha]|uniref:Uncharacterized protein n=1 Tax=Dreissena polymorpha TaxID=45954 RepID=A0A9D4RII9_DREPO|nr:hypothetical protein DPMN_033037 [Dreissena polymorpha]
MTNNDHQLICNRVGAFFLDASLPGMAMRLQIMSLIIVAGGMSLDNDLPIKCQHHH